MRKEIKEAKLDERTWEHTFLLEDQPVLRCSAVLPRFPYPDSSGLRRIDRYYEKLLLWWQGQWKKRSFPGACQRYTQCLEASLPFQPWEETVHCQITFHQQGILSLFWECLLHTGGSRPSSLRFGDTWDLNSGAPLSMKDFFPKGVKPSSVLPQLAGQQAGQAAEAGTSVYYPELPKLLRRHFDPRRFYLTDQALVFFYPILTIAPHAEGIPTFSVPFREEKTPFCLDI